MKLSLPDLRTMKSEHRPIVMITAYDHPTGRIVDAAGVDLVLVGDSAANVVLGHDSTVPATMDEMTILTRAVAAAVDHALVIGDLPFMSYQVSDEEAVRNAGRLVKDGGADAVKLEGGGPSLAGSRPIVASGIPVMGHLGLTPQTATMLGRPQGPGAAGHRARRCTPTRWPAGGGLLGVVLEACRRRSAAAISRRLAIPTIGIGSGAGTDGQVLVFHDMLGMRPPPTGAASSSNTSPRWATSSPTQSARTPRRCARRVPDDEHTTRCCPRRSRRSSARSPELPSTRTCSRTGDVATGRMAGHDDFPPHHGADHRPRAQPRLLRGARLRARQGVAIVRNGEREATNYFFSLGGMPDVLELTLNHDGRTYDNGTGYGHIAIGVDDLDGTLEQLKQQGIEPERPPYTVSDGGSRLCFVRDPDDYRIEIVEGRA